MWKENVNDTIQNFKNHDSENQLYKRLKKAKKIQVKYYDEKHTFRIFNVEDKILLNFKNIYTFKSFKKLDHKYYKSFEMQNLVDK